MAPARSRRTAFALAAAVLVSGALATVVALRAIDQAPPAADAPAARVPTAAEPRAQADVPRRRRVSVLRGAQREAAAAAERGLDEIARARDVLRGRAPGRQPAGRDDVPDDAFVLTLHRDGSEFRRGVLRNGKRHGLWSETFESGARVETSYRDGVRHGREAAWHADGRPRFLGAYEDGEMAGTWTAWHPNGNVLSTRQYASGRLQGVLRTFHESGALAEESGFEGGREHGVNRGWHTSGHLAWEIPYADGEREGHAVWFDTEGRLLSEGDYVRGALHGTFVEYAADGTVKRTERWDHGQRVARVE